MHIYLYEVTGQQTVRCYQMEAFRNSDERKDKSFEWENDQIISFKREGNG